MGEWQQCTWAGWLWAGGGADRACSRAQITDLGEFLGAVSQAFPHLTYLSMMKNPACPNYFVGKDADDYRRYRCYVLYKLTALKFLDASPVSAQERKDAKRLGPYMTPVKPVVPAQAAAPPPAAEPTDEFGALPADLTEEGRGSARFGISNHVYYGKHSEGNRFIMNDDL